MHIKISLRGDDFYFDLIIMYDVYKMLCDYNNINRNIFIEEYESFIKQLRQGIIYSPGHPNYLEYLEHKRELRVLLEYALRDYLKE